ncbi:MAG: VanZ family protein [Pyrinomonadaceae bacterium]
MTVNNLSKTIWRGRFIRYAPLFLWICVIFFLSSTLGSMSHTSRIIRPLLEWLFPDASAETITLYHAYVRKFAHFTEYAILAFWFWRAFRRSGSEFLTKYKYAVSLGLVGLVASIDEFGQSFNPTRTGSPYDVLLDISGGLTMIVFLWIFIKKHNQNRFEVS